VMIELLLRMLLLRPLALVASRLLRAWRMVGVRPFCMGCLGWYGIFDEFVG